jgi:hypothetical protein
LGYTVLKYDLDGLGARVPGDARVINEEQRIPAGRPGSLDNPYLGSGAVHDPEGQMVDGWERTNADFFANLKAMSGRRLRMRFQAVHRAIAEARQSIPIASSTSCPICRSSPSCWPNMWVRLGE